MEQTAAEPRASLLDRKISLRWVLILLAVVVLAALVLWILKALDCSRAIQQRERESAERTRVYARTLATAVALFGNRQIVARDYDTVQHYADRLVGREGVAYVGVTDASGRAVVHTNRKLRGALLLVIPERGVADASVPVMDLTRQAATVHVGLSAE